MVDDFGYIKDDRREPSIVNAYLVDNHHKRIVAGSEGTDKPLKTEMLKSHTSGGLDTPVARKQWGIAQKYDIHFMLFFYVNPTPGIKFTNPNDNAIIDRSEFVNWGKMFVRQVTDPNSQCLLERVARTARRRLAGTNLFGGQTDANGDSATLPDTGLKAHHGTANC